jgi:uncharacterized protein
VRETAGDTRHHRLGPAHQRTHVRLELDQPTQEGIDPGGLEAHRPIGQELLDQRRQLILPATVDDALGTQTGGLDALHPVVGAVEEILDPDLVAARALVELALELGHVPRHLGVHRFGLVVVTLDQTQRGLLERTALLLDQQQVAGLVHDHEVDLAVDREPLARPDVRPVHRVVHAVAVWQTRCKHRQRLDLALRAAGDFQFTPAVGDDLRHGWGPSWADGQLTPNAPSCSGAEQEVALVQRFPGHVVADTSPRKVAPLNFCTYHNPMEMELDSRKDVANLAKHGVSLADATRLDWNTLWAMDDRRRSYGEHRMIGYALMGNRLFCVVFTDRQGIRRIISLRKANNREIARYAEVSDTP